jgi:hypothetical protein
LVSRGKQCDDVSQLELDASNSDYKKASNFNGVESVAACARAVRLAPECGNALIIIIIIDVTLMYHVWRIANHVWRIAIVIDV